jgi:N-acetyl-alpha-D-muramate 1-phosphate uridylyltransferase
MKAMILAAGLGTRFKPWTDNHPKALAVINGKSLLERNILYLQSFGIKEVIVNVHHFADQILEAIHNYKGWGSEIRISDETGEVLETGGGLKKAADYFDYGSFVLMNVDILTDLDLAEMIFYHEEKKPLATLAVTDRKTSRYFLLDKNDRLSGWRNTQTGEEKISLPGPALIEKAFSGIHLISPEIFPLMRHEGKFSIVDVYLELAAAQLILGFDHSGSKLVDVGRMESVPDAEKLFPIPPA